MKKLYLVFVSALLVSACGGADVLTPWREGYLDIHQISTGRGNATLIQKNTTFGVASGYDK